MKSLLVEDNAADARLIREMLKGPPPGTFQVEHVARLAAAQERLGQETFDVVLLDLGLPDSQGLRTLTLAQEAAPGVPIVVLTGLDDEVFALEAMRAGAQDYLVKGSFDGQLLVRTIRYAIERKRAQEEIRRLNVTLTAERQRFSDVLNMMPAYVVLLSPDHHILFANHFFEERFGKSNGKRCYEYLFNRTEPCENCETFKVLKTNAPHHWEWTGPDGRNYDIHDFPFTDTDGAQVILEVGIDVTEVRKAQAALTEANQRLEERTAKLQELVGELEHFSYTITHDMRAPLRAMQGFSDLVTEACSECPEQEPKAFLRRIGTAAARMDLLITDALNYSRTVRQELILTAVDAGALLRGMLDSYPELQPSKAHIEIQGLIPLVMANEAGLTQCFSNLLDNAVKFVKPGQRPEIRIRSERRDGWVRIWVEDDGIGVPKLMQPRVFDMFSRGHQDYQGTGIGLALVRKVVERMDGKVGVESEEGKGSRFWLDLKPGEMRAAHQHK